MATSREMTAGRALPLIFNFTMPLLMGNLLQQTYSLVDAAIVGKFLGINALASVGASTSVVFLILGFCNGCCGGFGIPVAQKFGARDYSTMRRYISVSLQLAAVMSVVIAVVTSILCGDILLMMRTPDIIFQNAYYYLLIRALSARWGIVRRLSGFCCSLLCLIFCLICSVSWCWIGEWQGLPSLRSFHKVCRLCCVMDI